MPRHHRRDRVAIAHRLAHGDHVGHQAMPLEAPHASPGAAEARLDFVGDEQAARRADRRHRRLEEARRVGKDAVAGKNRVHQQGQQA